MALETIKRLLVMIVLQKCFAKINGFNLNTEDD